MARGAYEEYWSSLTGLPWKLSRVVPEIMVMVSDSVRDVYSLMASRINTMRSKGRGCVPANMTRAPAAGLLTNAKTSGIARG